jgi:hypothetical protein
MSETEINLIVIAAIGWGLFLITATAFITTMLAAKVLGGMMDEKVNRKGE